MMIFIDFDDVLLNTKKFIAGYREVFRKGGISDEAFEKYYYDYPVKLKNGKLIKYDSGEHLKRIEAKEKIKTKKLGSNIESFVGRIKRYVFPDAEKFLRRFKKGELYLVSYGRTKFQEDKIKSSGLEKYFEKTVIMDKLKASAISKMLEKKRGAREEKLYFLDDRAEQIEDVKKKIPVVTTIFVKRRDGRYRDKKSRYCDFEVKNLKEAEKIINSRIKS